jgi:hypothetical protein
MFDAVHSDMIKRHRLVEGFKYDIFKNLFMGTTKEVQNYISWLIYDANEKRKCGVNV